MPGVGVLRPLMRCNGLSAELETFGASSIESPLSMLENNSFAQLSFKSELLKITCLIAKRSS